MQHDRQLNGLSGAEERQRILGTLQRGASRHDVPGVQGDGDEGNSMGRPLVLHRAGGNPVATAFRKAAFGKDDPFARVREIAWEGSGAMVAGRASFIGELVVASFPHTETLVVVDGVLSLTIAGSAPLAIGPGAGVVIARGTAVHVLAVFRVRFVCCAVAGEGPTNPGLTPLRADAGCVRFATPDGSVLAASAADAVFVLPWVPDGGEGSERFANCHGVQGAPLLTRTSKSSAPRRGPPGHQLHQPASLPHSA